MRSSTWTSKPESKIFSIFIKLKGMNLTFQNGRVAWTKAKPEKTLKPLQDTETQQDSVDISQEQKFLSVLHFLFVKKKALVSYTLPEKYKETNKEKTQPGCPQACRSHTGWN